MPDNLQAVIEDEIALEYYFTAADGIEAAERVAGAQLPRILEQATICVLILHNGYMVVASAIAGDGAAYVPKVGQQLARRNACRKLSALVGYQLRTLRHAARNGQELPQ